MKTPVSDIDRICDIAMSITSGNTTLYENDYLSIRCVRDWLAYKARKHLIKLASGHKTSKSNSGLWVIRNNSTECFFIGGFRYSHNWSADLAQAVKFVSEESATSVMFYLAKPADQIAVISVDNI
jgi:hypothetical protein